MTLYFLVEDERGQVVVQASPPGAAPISFRLATGDEVAAHAIAAVLNGKQGVTHDAG